MLYDLRQNLLADRWSPYCPNVLKAIVLIGRLADEASLDRLCEIMASDSCMKTTEHKSDLFQPTPDDTI